MIADIINYIATHSEQLGLQITTHVATSLIALAVAVVIGVPSGYLASKSTKSEVVITAPFEMLRVVPSLAVLILLIPVMGTGIMPAVTALAILAVPPVLLSTSVGFRSIPDFMVESARGIGMTERELLFKVRIPGAMPMMLAGIRTALVEIVASATLAAKIGGGGLGEIIFTGLGLNRTDMLILGGLLVAALSLFFGVLFDVLTRKLLKYKYV